MTGQEIYCYDGRKNYYLVHGLSRQRCAGKWRRLCEISQ